MNKDKNRIGKKVLVLTHILRRNMDRDTEEVGISGPQSRILHFIVVQSQSREVYQRDVENDFHIRRSSVTSLVQNLEKEGLIQRVSVKEDARLKKLIVTDKGRHVDDEIGNKIDANEKEIDEILGENKELFGELLDQLIQGFNEE